eukprot:Partr_v1_DN26157_c0_g1_i2_m10392 putative argininosuccinate synthase
MKIKLTTREDLKAKFVTDTVFPAIQANCQYEGVYLMGTALARPIIAARQIQLAHEHSCDFVSHGCTGKGNDQVRFELAYYALSPSIRVIAPWRDPVFFQRFVGRSQLIEYAASKGIPVTQTKAKPWSTDENLFHISYEAGILEDPDTAPPADMWKLTRGLQEASPDGPEMVELHFDKGLPSLLRCGAKEFSDPLALFMKLNELGKYHGIGRIDIVENRFVGIKSRGCYETPAGTILLKAHIDLEGLTMDREVRKLRDEQSRRLTEIIYNGMWFSPEREYLQHCITFSQLKVSGVVKLELYKGNVTVKGRSSEHSLYDQTLSSMDDIIGFDPADAGGFIRVQAIRLSAGSASAKK